MAEKKPLDTNKKDVFGTPQTRLQDLINLVTQTAKVKGWQPHVVAQDKANYRYATVEVSRYVDHETVKGTFELTCDDQIQVSYHKTSFHSYGLEALQAAIGNELKKLPYVQKEEKQPKNNTLSSLDIVERVLRKFHSVAKQLKNRQRQRAGIVIKDEYDVQDIVHVLLRGLFDDVRTEEHTPSYAGSSTRMDFLLKAEKIVIEIKLASSKLRDKEIGSQLVQDIAHYQNHLDCKQLVCFVYDPQSELKNPTGLEADLGKKHGNLEVKVIIVP